MFMYILKSHVFKILAENKLKTINVLSLWPCDISKLFKWILNYFSKGSVLYSIILGFFKNHFLSFIIISSMDLCLKKILKVSMNH